MKISSASHDYMLETSKDGGVYRAKEEWVRLGDYLANTPGVEATVAAQVFGRLSWACYQMAKP